MDESYKKTVNAQVLFKKTIQRTKNFLHKTPHNIKSFLFGGHHKLPKARQFNPFSSTSRRISKSKLKEWEDLYREYYQQKHQPDHNEISERKNTGSNATKYNGIAEGQGSESQRKITVQFGKKDVEGERRKEEVKTAYIYHEEKRPETFSRSTSKRDYALAQQMKDLEMMDGEDVDQVLDIEEVLHCYSLLNSPLYLDIVDNFFIDIYAEFSLPKPSRSINSSMRSLGPIRI